MINLLARLFNWWFGRPKNATHPTFTVLVTFPLPLSWALRVLWMLAFLRRRSFAPVLDIARTHCGVAPADLARWYRLAWWGHVANNACLVRGSVGRLSEIAKLVEPVDWAPLDALRAQGKGVLLGASHYGPPYAMRLAQARDGRSVFTVGVVRTVQPPVAMTGEQLENTYASVEFLKGFDHLRRGGVVSIAADGPVHANYLHTHLGRPFLFGVGAARLTHMMGSPTLFSFSHWDGFRIRIVFSAPLPRDGSPLGPWTDTWIHRYAQWLDEQVRANPCVLHFNTVLHKVNVLGARDRAQAVSHVA